MTYMPPIAFEAIYTLAGITDALRNGLEADWVYHALTELTRPGDPLYSVCERLTGAAEHHFSAQEIASALASVVPDLENTVSHDTEQYILLEDVKQDLADIQSGARTRSPHHSRDWDRARTFRFVPAVFEPSALDVMRRFYDAVSHQVLNPLTTVWLNLQIAEAAAVGNQALLDAIREAQAAVQRASRFVQDMSSVTAPIPGDSAPATAVLMARADAAFDWKPPLPQEENIPPPSSRSSFNPLASHILYIEDDPEIAELIQEMLKLRGFTNIHWVDSAQAALSVFEDNPRFSVVVSDYNLGCEMDGLDVARHIRKQHPNIPFIFTTGSEREIRERFSDPEKREFRVLAKPFETEHLEKEIIQAIESNFH